MEHSGRSIPESVSITDGLGHCLRHVQPLIALALNMDTREAHKVRRGPIAHSLPRLHIVPVPLEELDKLQLTRTALALACSTHWDLRSVRC